MNRAKLTLLAVISIAMTFTFSCSGDDGEGGDAQSSSSVVPSSSSAGGSGSSSSAGSSASCDGFVDGTETEHHGMPKKQFCDSRNGQKYVYVTIGTQTWMAENLNYAAAGSKCGSFTFLGSPLVDVNTDVCDTYGRLYDWATAMGFDEEDNCDTSYCTSKIAEKHRGVCPEGWHLPSDAEWDILVKYVDPNWVSMLGNNVAGIKLKSKDGWKRNPVDDKDGNGTDDYGFTALQGGFGIGGLFNDDDMGEWWSTTQFVADVAHSRAMSIYSENVRKFDSKKFFFYSVRCLKD